MKCQCGSIRQIHKQLTEDGIFISEYCLRQWVKAGQLKAVLSGKKAYIRYNDVVALLDELIGAA